MLRRPVFALLWAVALMFMLVFAPARARAATAWTPPPLNGHVVDTANALTRDEARALDLKLDSARKQTGFAIVVLILPHLPDGLTIEDVGYQAGNTWGVGSAKGDDGVLLVNSVAEHKLRIETGKGVGGALTDIASSHINRDVIGPLLKEGRTYDAMNAGTDAILKELVENTPGGKTEAGQGPQKSTKQPGTRSGTGGGKSAVESASAQDLGHMAIWIVIVVGVIGLAIYSPTFRSILFYLLFFGRWGGGGGGGSGFGGGGGGGGGGSGYGGGGGSFGGGGSSDDY